MAKTFIKEFEDWLRLEMWTLDDALMILGGAIRSQIGNPSSELNRIIDGNQKIDIGEFNRVKTLWYGSIHNHDSLGLDGEKAFPKWDFLKARPMTVRPCYVINWADKKGIDMPWLIEAKELGFKVCKPALKDEAGTPVVQEEISQTKIDNELRVWGHLLKVVKEAYKCDQKTLITKIQASVDPDELRNKGLGERNIKEVFAKANKVLEDDKN
jgi:hypothetical protein